MAKELAALTGLRGVAALWVLAYHLMGSNRFMGLGATWFGPVAAAGYLGVDLFFVLSGFILSYTYTGKPIGSSLLAYGGFLWKRFARIYPVHLVTMIAFAIAVSLYSANGRFLIHPNFAQPVDFVRALTLSNAWTAMLFFAWNGPSWSLSAEWGAYIVFPFILPLLTKVRGAAAGIVGIVVLQTLMYLVLRRYSYYAIEVTLMRISVGFISGCLLYRLMSAGLRFPAGGMALVLLIALSNQYDMRMGFLSAAPYFGLFACAAVLGLATHSCVVARALSKPSMLYLGRISYSIYLCHYLLMHMVQISALASYPIAPLVTAAASIAAAHLLYTYVEEPARHRMANGFQALSGQRAADAP